MSRGHRFHDEQSHFACTKLSVHPCFRFVFIFRQVCRQNVLRERSKASTALSISSRHRSHDSHDSQAIQRAASVADSLASDATLHSGNERPPKRFDHTMRAQSRSTLARTSSVAEHIPSIVPCTLEEQISRSELHGERESAATVEEQVSRKPRALVEQVSRSELQGEREVALTVEEQVSSSPSSADDNIEAVLV